MANTIALAQKYIADINNFNQVYKYASLTADLEANQIKVLDGNTVKLPKYAFSNYALPTYSRDSGTTVVDLIESWNTYTLTQDKGTTLKLDVMDDEETLSQGLIKRANEYVRQVIVPAVDTYRFGVLATVPTPATTPTEADLGSKIVTDAVLTTSNVFEKIDAAFKYQADNEVPKTDLILYVTPATRHLMQRSTDISKKFDVQTVQGEISTVIEYYNGAKIVEVPSGRLGAGISFMLVQPKAVASCVKFNESVLVNLTETDAKFFGFAWKWRMYYDLFIAAGPAITEGTGANKTLVNPGVYVYKETSGS